MEGIITWTTFLVGFLTELCLFIWGYVDFFATSLLALLTGGLKQRNVAYVPDC